MLKQRIKDYVNSHRDEIVSTLMELVKIPSVSTDRISCDKMQLAVRSLYENYGFSVTEGEEYILAHFGDGKEEIGLFAHSDVVDGGEGWLLTTPFEPIIHEGVIVGRGAWDDKSAVVHSFYALRALKELNIPITKKVVAFIGFNEENGMSDIKNYIKESYSFSAKFLINPTLMDQYNEQEKITLILLNKNIFQNLFNVFAQIDNHMIFSALSCLEYAIRSIRLFKVLKLNHNNLYKYIRDEDFNFKKMEEILDRNTDVKKTQEFSLIDFYEEIKMLNEFKDICRIAPEQIFDKNLYMGLSNGNELSEELQNSVRGYMVSAYKALNIHNQMFFNGGLSEQFEETDGRLFKKFMEYVRLYV